MERYGNIQGNSGVLAYEIHPDRIKVKFRAGPTYEYSHRRPGKHKVEVMKRLARSGRGLATYISQHVRDQYERMTE